jgi:hypothetical protein
MHKYVPPYLFVSANRKTESIISITKGKNNKMQKVSSSKYNKSVDET